MTRRGLLLFAVSMLFSVSISSGHSSVNTQNPRSTSDPFDRYGRINWENEKQRVDRFAQELQQRPEMIGYIYIREAQISCEGYAIGHGIELTKYLIQTHHVAWNRVSWRDLGYGDSYEVSLWLFPAGRPPQYQPAYHGEAVYIEDCESLIQRSRAEARRRRRRHRR